MVFDDFPFAAARRCQLLLLQETQIKLRIDCRSVRASERVSVCAGGVLCADADGAERKPTSIHAAMCSACLTIIAFDDKRPLYCFMTE